MKRVLTGGELPNFLAVVERRQAHRTLAADFLTVLVVFVLNSRRHVTRTSSINDHHGDGGAGEPGGSLPPEAAEIGRTPDGEEEGVD